MIKHRSRRGLESIVIFFLLAVTCRSLSVSPTMTAVVTTPEWVLDWLENPECAPPCWQGITPGVTDMTTARQIQSKYPNLSIWGEDDASPVRLVWLNLSFYDVLPISSIIAEYGEPGYVGIYKCDPDDKCATHILFDKIGMIVDVYPENIGEGISAPAVEIAPSTNVLKIYFTQPGIEGYFGIPFFSGAFRADLIPWQGFRQYPP